MRPNYEINYDKNTQEQGESQKGTKHVVFDSLYFLLLKKWLVYVE